MWTETTDRRNQQGTASATLAAAATPSRADRDRSSEAGERGFEPATLRALLAQLPVAVLLVDREGGVTYSNDAARRLRAAGPLSAWPDVRQLPPALAWPVARALLTGDVVRDEELTIAGLGGQGRCMGVSFTPVQTAGDDGAAGVLTLVDLTDGKLWEAWAPAIASLGRL